MGRGILGFFLLRHHLAHSNGNMGAGTYEGLATLAMTIQEASLLSKKEAPQLQLMRSIQSDEVGGVYGHA